VVATSIASPAISAGTVSAQRNGIGQGAMLGIIIAVACGGGLLFALYRRRIARPLQEPAIAADPVYVPRLEVLADPLLEAMASTARAKRPRKASTKALIDDEPRVAAWVKRLDAEINTLADLRASPSPPPHDPVDTSAGSRTQSPEQGSTSRSHLRAVGR
jgi:hypothetical protein